MAKNQTELYIQHPGLKTLIFDVITADTPDGEMTRAIMSPEKPHLVRAFGKENIGIYVMLPDELAPKPIPEDEDGPFSMFLIPNKTHIRPKRFDLRISPSDKPHHIRVVLVADEDAVRFDGDVPVHVDDEALEKPFILEAKSPNQAVLDVSPISYESH